MNSEKMITVHYHRPLGDYDGWELWVWCVPGDYNSRALAPCGRDDFGLTFVVEPGGCAAGATIGLLPRRGHWIDKDPPDRFWSPAEGGEIWIVNGVAGTASQRPDTSPFIVGAWIDAPSVISAWFSSPLKPAELTPDRFEIVDPEGAGIRVVQVGPGRDPGALTGDGILETELVLSRPVELPADDIWSMELHVRGYRPKNLGIGRLLDGPEYTSDAEMGAICTPVSTRFRVFAPTASLLTVNLYSSPAGGVPHRHRMKLNGKGIWELTIPGDLNGTYYTLSAAGPDPRFDPRRELIDPYSRCNTAHDGRALLFRDETPIADRPRFPAAEAIICELHLRDFSISPDSGIAAKGKYPGLGETGTRLPSDRSIATGLDHLVELGINTVQIMPFQDFENDESSPRYSWGYMPVHFNAPDGWYATDLAGTARVVEAKKMIDALHRQGIRVVMDVVYNHTAENRPDKVFSFQGLVPGYYYRLRRDGTFSDGSGTGNEFRSEAPMARKFIIDSVKYWVNEYKVDGFRFDLLGLIDRGTLIQVVRELKAIDPGLLIYGEPWAGGPTPITVTGKGAQRGQGFAVFNDDFRDAVKGQVFGGGTGYVQDGGLVWRVKRGLKGSIDDFALEPLESVNYVECHDNLTLWDKLTISTRERPGLSDADRVRMDRLAAALILLAQGIPYIQIGQEMLRTKGGRGNTYDQPDEVNQVEWSRKKEMAAVVSWYRELIALRRAHPIFRRATAGEIRAHFRWFDEDLGLGIDPAMIAFLLDRGAADDPWEAAAVLVNPAAEPRPAPLPPGEWRVFCDGDSISAARPVRAEPVTARYDVPARSVVILARMG